MARISGLSLVGLSLSQLAELIGPYIAHRGVKSCAPESTLEAFELAAVFRAEDQAQMIEFDVQLSLDNQLVVIHDETVDRTAHGLEEGKSHKVKDLTLAELKELDAGLWFSKDFAGARIPSLEEVVDLCLKLNLLMNLEIKTSDRHPETESGLDQAQDIKITKALISWLEKIKAENLDLFEKIFSRLLISSFSPEALYLVREAFPKVNLAYLVEIKNWDQDWALRKAKIKADMSALNCVSLNLNQDVFDLKHKEIRRAEIKEAAGSALLLAYTVNDFSRAEELRREFGVSAVFTDKLVEEACVM